MPGLALHVGSAISALLYAALLRWLLLMLRPGWGRPASRESGMYSVPILLISALAAAFVRIRIPGMVNDSLAMAGVVLVATGLLVALPLAALDAGFALHRRRTESEILAFVSAAGMCALVATDDLWTAFVAFELSSLPLYAMVALGGHSDARRAAFRLVLPGAVATLLFILGAALLGGPVGSVPTDPLAWFGWTAIVTAVLYKGGLLPYGFWVGDVFRGTPTGVLAFLAGAPKWIALVFLGRLVAPALSESGVRQVLEMAAVLSLAVGTILALQRDAMRPILGWSGVAHVGFGLLILLGPRADWAGAFVLYGGGYIIGTGAILAALTYWESIRGDDRLSSLVGISRVSPVLGAAGTVALLSLAGIPFLLGFWGKAISILAAVRGHAWSGFTVALVATVVGLFVYLRIVGRTTLDSLPVDVDTRTRPPHASAALVIYAVVAAALVLLLGAAPSWVLSLLGFRLL